MGMHAATPVVGCQIQDRPWAPVGEQETDPFQMQGGTNPLDFLFQFTIVKGNVTVGKGECDCGRFRRTRQCGRVSLA